MTVIVAGSRGASRADVEYAIRAARFKIGRVISGCAPGADSHGEAWARQHFIPVDRMPADWNRYGKSAGPRRNQAMLERADGLIVAWDGTSRGTADMLRRALNAPIWTFCYVIGDGYVRVCGHPEKGACRCSERP